MRKKIIFAFMSVIVLFSAKSSMDLQAAESTPMLLDEVMMKEEAQISLGILCPGCKSDSWEFAWYEQVGISGMTHRVYYKCTNCGGLTFITMHAR